MSSCSHTLSRRWVQEGPIHASNVMHYSKEQGVRSRVGIKVLENGDKVRFLRKTGEVIDKKE